VQAGAEVLSSTDNPAIEAEVTEMPTGFLGGLGIPRVICGWRMLKAKSVLIIGEEELKTGHSCCATWRRRSNETSMKKNYLRRIRNVSWRKCIGIELIRAKN